MFQENSRKFFFLLVKEVDQYFIFIYLSSVSVMRSLSIVGFGLNTFLRVNIKPGMILHVTSYEVPLLKWSDEAPRIILSSSTFDVCTPSKTCLILSIAHPGSGFIKVHPSVTFCCFVFLSLDIVLLATFYGFRVSQLIFATLVRSCYSGKR